MKKHLIAAAVAAAVAVPAVAQVTISGVIDTGVGSVNSGAASFTGSVNGILSTSNFAFRGTEDLGGGLKASFAIIKEFTASSGLESDNTTTANTFAAGVNDTQLDRFANLFVSVSGGFGTVTLGKQQALARNAGGAGSIIGNQGLSGTYGTTSSRGLGDKVNDALSYTTPTFNGFTAQVLRGSRQAATAAAAVVSSASVAAAEAKLQTTAIGATYVAGPFKAGVGSLTRELTAASKANAIAYGISYNLGVVNIGLLVNSHDPSDIVSNDELVTTVLNLSVPMGGKVTLTGALHEAKQGSGADRSASGMVVGANYVFSKRTTGYASYARVDNGANTSYTISGMSSTATTGLDPKTVAIGVRHSF